ncbi:MAG: hypothetical protein FJ395_22065, partial [Verrucomicrobia bacterium]|nr:hypothetical protein [Verrucomicrobiota bacterium]
MKKFLQIAHRDERGVALILTLAILVLVTLLVVGFAINMRVETAISKNYTEQVRARQFALAAVDEAVALLRLATPPISITTNWASGPGMIFMRTGSGSYTNIPLCSLDDSGDEPFDINYRRLRRIMRTDNTNLFVGWKRWVLPNQPTTGRDNLIGRYCYWIDDEASKININTARRRPASPNPPTYTPEDIDLRDLNRVTGGVFDSETAANLSYQFGTNTGYASPNSWSVIDPNNVSFALFCHSNHFRTTTFSQD